MKRRQHRQRAARQHAPAAAAPLPAPAPVESLSAAGEEDPGAAVDTLVSPGTPVPGAGQAVPPPPDEAPPRG